jgi:hypothetical protein
MHSGAQTQEWVANIARQAAFARGYSPLYAAILDALAGWLAGGSPTGGSVEAVMRLRQRFWAFIGARTWDNDLEPILKLAATLHSHVLRDDPRVAGLRRYYGTVTIDAASPDEPAFAGALLHALDLLGDDLLTQANDWVIQTNETARGVVWLLPAALLQIEAAYLVELGTSAGLNLLADHRRYALRWPNGAEWTLGHAETPQFELECEGPTLALPAHVRPPEILGRTGADARLVDLDAPDAETQLAACIWGDQPRRLERLQEALALRRRFRGTPQASRLLRTRLPDETEEFLRAAVPVHPVAPVILFDTYVTAYFNDVDHRALVRAVEAFARPWTLRHKLSWLWVRFEPPRGGEPEAPQIGWCRWWVEVWTQGQHHSLELGWGHPHCVKLAFGSGLARLAQLRGPE